MISSLEIVWNIKKNQFIIEWLLEDNNPSIWYRTLTELLGKSRNDPEVSVFKKLQFKNHETLLILTLLLFSFSLTYQSAFAQELLRNRIKEKRLNRNAQETEGDIRNSILVDGRERTYILHLPSACETSESLPLVFVLHGGGGSAENARRMSAMNAKADKEGFIVVYPNGSGRFKNKLLTWNAGHCCAYALKNRVDDVAFFRSLIAELEQTYPVDSKRIYVTGLSNGGMMAYRLACELSDKIAAIAPVAGSLPIRTCNPSSPVSILVFHGTDDQHVPYSGGIGKDARLKILHPSVSEAIRFWVEHNTCSPTPQKEEFGNIVKETYTGGKHGTEVILYTIKGGGHSWPGGRKGSRYGNVDLPTQEISATDLIWEFFSRHPQQ